jgi:hypothetical protein
MKGRRRVRSSQRHRCSPSAVSQLLTIFGYPTSAHVFNAEQGVCYYGLTLKDDELWKKKRKKESSEK